MYNLLCASEAPKKIDTGETNYSQSNSTEARRKYEALIVISCMFQLDPIATVLYVAGTPVSYMCFYLVIRLYG